VVIHKGDCPICTIGLTLSNRRMVVQEIGGITTLLPHHYSICDTCGMEVGSPEDNRRNAEITQKLLMRMLSA
jgi:YgiT-type zinc finger domain-containing protein